MITNLPDILLPFKDHIISYAYVGSRVTCNPAPTDTDLDILVHVKSYMNIFPVAVGEGYDYDGSIVEPLSSPHIETDSSMFFSMSKDKVNLILTDNSAFFQKFIAASSIAKGLNLLKKSDRIALFQAVLYGKDCDNFNVVRYNPPF